MRFTEYQKHEIEKNYKDLKEELGDGNATVENLAHAMQKECSDIDYEDALSVCSRIHRGAEVYDQLYKGRDALAKPDYAENLLDSITEQMGREQRKGFFLQSLDIFEEAPLSAEDTAERAAMQEGELKSLLEKRIKEFVEMAVSEMEDTLEDPCFHEAKGEYQSENRPEEDVFLFAAAEYMASLDGALPMEFGQYPEMLGICAAAQMTMIHQYEVYHGEYEVYSGEYEVYSEIMGGILYTVACALLAIGSAAIFVAAESVLEAMAFSAAGCIVAVIIGASLYMGVMCGCIGALGGIIFLVLEACVWKWNDCMPANQKDIGAAKTRDERTSQKQEDEEINYQEVMA